MRHKIIYETEYNCKIWYIRLTQTTWRGNLWLHPCWRRWGEKNQMQWGTFWGLWTDYVAFSSERVVYRPRKYELENVFCADGYAVINQMIKKQSNNRYFNRNANHLGYRNSLIRYIKQLIEKFEFSIESFHLSCAILDAIFSLYAILP